VRNSFGTLIAGGAAEISAARHELPPSFFLRRARNRQIALPSFPARAKIKSALLMTQANTSPTSLFVSINTNL